MLDIDVSGGGKGTDCQQAVIYETAALRIPQMTSVLFYKVAPEKRQRMEVAKVNYVSLKPSAVTKWYFEIRRRKV